MSAPDRTDDAFQRPARLRVVRDRVEVDPPAAADAVTTLLPALGKDPADPHLAGTPRRAADAFAGLLTPRRFDLTTFPHDEGYHELVLATDIPVQSLCEHHLLPFTGVAHIGLPAGGPHPRVPEVRPGAGDVRPRPAGPGAAHPSRSPTGCRRTSPRPASAS